MLIITEIMKYIPVHVFLNSHCILKFSSCDTLILAMNFFKKQPKKPHKLPEVPQIDILILPQEIWRKIFDHLDYTELISTRLVSKSFNDIISNDPDFINHTQFNVKISTKKNLKVAKNSQRNFFRICVTYADSCKYFLETLLLFTNLTTLELNCCTFWGSEFLTLLRVRSTIKALSFYGVEVKGIEEQCEPVNLKLTSIILLGNIDQNSDWIFQHLNCSEITRFLQTNCCSYFRKSASFFKFLEQIEGVIKFIRIDYIDQTGKIPLTHLKTEKSPDFKFKWDNLHMTNHIFKGPNELLDLPLDTLYSASSEGSTLKILSLYEYEEMGNSIKVLKSCTNINSLDLDCNLAIFIESYLIASTSESFKPVESIKNLTLCNRCSSIDSTLMTEILKIFPNIENLRLKFGVLQSITSSNIKLMDSKIKSLSLELVCDLENYFYTNYIDACLLNDRRGISNPPSEFYNIFYIPEIESVTLGPLENYIEFPQKAIQMLTGIIRIHRKLKDITLIASKRFTHGTLEKFLSSIFEDINMNNVKRMNIVRVQNSCDSHIKSSAFKDYTFGRTFKIIASMERN